MVKFMQSTDLIGKLQLRYVTLKKGATKVEGKYSIDAYKPIEGNEFDINPTKFSATENPSFNRTGEIFLNGMEMYDTTSTDHSKCRVNCCGKDSPRGYCSVNLTLWYFDENITEVINVQAKINEVNEKRKLNDQQKKDAPLIVMALIEEVKKQDVVLPGQHLLNNWDEKDKALPVTGDGNDTQEQKKLVEETAPPQGKGSVNYPKPNKEDIAFVKKDLTRTKKGIAAAKKDLEDLKSIGDFPVIICLSALAALLAGCATYGIETRYNKIGNVRLPICDKLLDPIIASGLSMVVTAILYPVIKHQFTSPTQNGTAQHV